MWSEIVEQGKAGELWIDPAIARTCHDAAEKWLETLTEMANKSLHLGIPEGFPDLDSAQALANKFGDKATHPTDGLQARLSQFITAGEQLSELFLASIKKFELTDEDSATYLRGLELHGSGEVADAGLHVSGRLQL